MNTKINNQNVEIRKSKIKQTLASKRIIEKQDENEQQDINMNIILNLTKEDFEATISNCQSASELE